MEVRNMEKLNVLDNEISVKTINNKDFISLTDLLKSKDGEFYIRLVKKS